MLSQREFSDIETLYRLFGIKTILYFIEDDIFIAKQHVKTSASFLVLDPKDFPSLEKKNYNINDIFANQR